MKNASLFRVPVGVEFFSKLQIFLVETHLETPYWRLKLL
jgi:hypothetical protein